MAEAAKCHAAGFYDRSEGTINEAWPDLVVETGDAGRLGNW